MTKCRKCKNDYLEIPEAGIYAKDRKCGNCQDLEALAKANEKLNTKKKRKK